MDTFETNCATVNYKIHFILTGGTIDSYYDVDKCTVLPFEHSVIPKYINEFVGLKNDQVIFTEICMKDSRDLDEIDMKNVLNTIEESPHNKFIITLGTYTLFNNALYLQSNLKKKNDLTVVLTGSMIPLEGFVPSDAAFNLGYAISEVCNLPPGVYICINGKKYLPENNPHLHS